MQNEQQDAMVTIASNHIHFAHGIEFVHYGDLAELLAQAQCFGEVDETDLHEVFSCLIHREALLSAAQNGDLPIKDKSTKTKVTLGSVQLHKNKIDNSTCVTVEDFRAYAEPLGVTVSVAELSNGTQENEVAVSPEQRPIQRATAQNAAILNAIETKGYEAKSLPKSKPGKSGVKAVIRTAVATNSLFQGTIFNRAWERLRSSGEIKDAV
jgi:hypothetical protein